MTGTNRLPARAGWLLWLLLSACALLESGPDATVRRFYRALEAGDAAAAHALLSSDSRAQLSEDKIRLAIAAAREQSENKGGMEEFSILDSQVDGDRATVRIRETYGNGETDEETVILVLEDGKWRVRLEK